MTVELIEAFAGVGSRTITEKEEKLIERIARQLSKKFVCYSGNAPGADQAFQRGSDGRCVLYLPWMGFESEAYPYINALDVFDLGKSPEGMQSVKDFHPNPNLKYGAKMMMARNYHQIMGYKTYPKVSFVVFCADEDEKGNVSGGTGQAVRIARAKGIPTINIRLPGWKEKLTALLKTLSEKNK